ncbi:unnamed protein product, partial [Ixodes hexagonus]
MGNRTSKLKPVVLEDIWSSTEFSHVEILQWYRDFIRGFPDGRIPMSVFQDVYGKFFPGGDSSKFASDVFRTFDTNKDGFIDFREFMCGLNSTCRGKPEKKCEWAFNMYDTNGDGRIQKHEMVEMITTVFKMVGSSKKLVLKENLTPEQLTDKIFLQMDKDGDGSLTFQEFFEGAKKDPVCIRLLLGD